MSSTDNPIRSVIIVGGGLGGLTLAQKLRGTGVSATVYERDESRVSRAQGYMIGLDENGLKALHKLPPVSGLLEMLKAQSVSGFQILDKNLVSVIRLAFRSDVATSSLVNRMHLREVLTQNVNVQWQKRFSRYEEHADGVDVFFEDGTSARADILVGADGANSRVRQQLCPSIVYEDTGVTSIGGWLLAPPDSTIPKLSEHMRDNMVRTMGPNSLTVLNFYFKNFADENSVIWALSHRKELSEPYPPSSDLEALKAFALLKAETIHAELAEVVKRTPPENILVPRQVHTVRPDTLSALLPKSSDRHGRVTLLGDAAHAMTTHRGLGANTAFQDAIDLAEALQNRTSRRSLYACVL
eukprot:TRINITY_DN4106_c0_g1_i1.p1 TRINITY_DN4106_c0_g1~~TRINITY_DN4106_c0_g1_i1.p1  ORF type:complete len:374 (+),score=73.01 TRINITY_DN4106_c0_g1_i1:58-1122(+)